MDTEELRLKCLELAIQRQGAYDKRGVIAIATNFVNFVADGTLPESDDAEPAGETS